MLLYPAGHLDRLRSENLGGNSAVQTLIAAVPDVRVVLIRTRGLWGSGFSWASGQPPKVSGVLRKGLRSLLISGVFFAPKREVTIEICEPADFPRPGESLDKNTINSYLENYYNDRAPRNTYVPYSIWDPRGTRQLPEPQWNHVKIEAEDIPQQTRQIVLSYLQELSGVDELRESDELGADLGLDSLARSELMIFLSREFGFDQGDTDSLQTVSDVLLWACGEPVGGGPTSVEIKPIPSKWFADDTHRSGRIALSVPKGPSGELPKTIADAFIAQARLTPDRPIIADQSSGVKTYRDLITAILVLRPIIEKLPSDRIGIMLPASVTADVVYLATLFAGKTAVMVNWTLGVRNMSSSLETSGAKVVLTARKLIGQIESQGVEFGELTKKFVYLEEITGRISKWTKVRAAVMARLNFSSSASLAAARVSDIAVILFTSGSETVPKAVPLTHANVLTNLADASKVFDLWRSDRMLGFLPPFHSFGFTVGMLGPLCLGLPTAYHPSPNDSVMLGKLIEAYRVTMLVGTPTFINGIVQVSTGEQLKTLRLCITGGESCPQRVYSTLLGRCPQMTVLEGYGVTECSPIISGNDQASSRAGTIGKVLPSFEYVLVDPESNQQVPEGRAGVLLVRGPSVFDGYIADAATRSGSPFVEFAGKSWYRTGDLVTEDPDGVLTFCGRLKRFAKIGGEMVSLPAIEAVLAEFYPQDDGEGPVMAVEAFTHASGKSSLVRPELVLFSTIWLDRQAVNKQLREGGLSGLHNIRQIIHVDRIPVLGTGKTDYRALRSMW